MRRTFVAAGALLALVVPTTAQGATLREKYEHRYEAVEERFGEGAAGRHIVDDGVRVDGEPRPARDREIARSARTLLRMLERPTPAQAGAGSAGSGAASGGGYAIPSSIVACESGGDPNAYNPSSGAGGLYQIIPSTWRAYGGTGAPHTAPVEEQHRVAARVWAGQGRGAWDC